MSKKFIIPVKKIERIDKYLSFYLKKSRKEIEDLIDSKMVKLNGKNIKKNKLLKTDDFLEIILSKKENFIVKEKNIFFKIIFEDEYILVINKPKNLIIHPTNKNHSGTLVNGLLNLNIQLSDSKDSFRPGIVHRLDKDTSGILVVAKNNYSYENLKMQFKKHTIKRIYFALISGKLNEKSGEIDLPIKRDFKNRIKFIIENNGKNAKTYYKIIENYNNYSLIACKLKTGRTHQIRVHFSSINHPLIGDYVYGKIEKNNFFSENKGQFLHAGILGFFHPFTKRYIEFFEPLPKYFSDVLKKIQTI